MNRGKGLELKHKYKWCKQPNGKYTVFGVPIFTTFKREDFDEKGNKILRSAGPKDLKNILKYFHEKKEKGYYMPIHEGHQDLYGVSNAKHLGYIDNMQLVGNTVYVDLAELEEYAKNEIKNLRLPYCSCEYKPGKIEGLAMLSTKPPYFKNPLIALEDEPSEITGEYIQMFQDREKVFQFSEGENLDEEKKEEGLIEEKDQEKEYNNNDLATQMAGCMQKFEESQGNLSAILEKIAAGQEKIIDFLFQEENEELEENELPEEGEEEITSNNPESVAMSAPARSTQQFASKLERKINQMIDFQQKSHNAMQSQIDQIKGLRETSQFEDKLKALSMTANVDYESNRQYMQQFSDSKDKQLFLDYIENNALQMADNPANAILTAVNNRKSDSSNYMQQFSGKSPRVLAAARKAQQDYRDTINGSNPVAVQKFRKQWPSEQAWVENQVDHAEIMFG